MSTITIMTVTQHNQSREEQKVYMGGSGSQGQDTFNIEFLT
jgi:hypothetical protein